MLLPSLCSVCREQAAVCPLSVCPACENDLMRAKVPAEISSGAVRGIFSCRYYTGTARECVRRLKYYRESGMMLIFDRIMKRSAPDGFLAGAPMDLVVPVPIHPRRLRRRGFNQSDMIAAKIASLADIPVSRGCLIKIKDTPPQTRLTRGQRLRNLKGSFGVADPAAVKNKTILLVDDVMTTGATLNTCASELLDSGAKAVYAFTLTRTP